MEETTTPVLKKYLFLDDVRNLNMLTHVTNLEMRKFYGESDNWYIVRSYDEFISYLTTYYSSTKTLPEIISFDHDLSDEHYTHAFATSETLLEAYDTYKEKTGYHCAEYLISFCLDNNVLPPEKLFIHSQNFSGSRNILSVFASFEKLIKRFGMNMLRISRWLNIKGFTEIESGVYINKDINCKVVFDGEGLKAYSTMEGQPDIHEIIVNFIPGLEILEYLLKGCFKI
jgi:hypothetical protein